MSDKTTMAIVEALLAITLIPGDEHNSAITCGLCGNIIYGTPSVSWAHTSECPIGKILRSIES